jgi:hypothetical protein
MSRRHPKRKTSSGRFAMVPVSVLEHIAVRTLSHAAFRVLVLLAAAYNGGNNGALGVTAGQAEASGVGSRNTLYRALHELEGRGLIVQTYAASRVPPRPTMWAVTWKAVDDTEWSRKTTTPAHAYRDWKPSRAVA